MMFTRVRRAFIFFVLTALTAKMGYCQTELQFSQYMFNTLYINPGYAGYQRDPNVSITYRDQWTGFPGAPKTISLSADAPVSGHSAFGVQITNDKLGVQNSFSATGIYAYHLPLSETARLSFGAGWGISQFYIDASRYTPLDGNDAFLAKNYSSLYVNAKFGLFFYNERYYLGVSASNLYQKQVHSNDATVKWSDLPRTYYLTGGALLPIASALALKPSILVRTLLNYGSSADLNLSFVFYNRFWVGTSYRSGYLQKRDSMGSTLSGKNSLVFLTQFSINQSIRIGYTYDYPLSPLNNAQTASHEISVGWLIPRSQRSQNRDMYRDPVMFPTNF